MLMGVTLLHRHVRASVALLGLLRLCHVATERLLSCIQLVLLLDLLLSLVKLYGSILGLGHDILETTSVVFGRSYWLLRHTSIAVKQNAVGSNATPNFLGPLFCVCEFEFDNLVILWLGA